jgi:hypothetical protein
MWKVRKKTVPVIIGALGTIKKGVDQHLQVLPGQLQRITPMSPAHIICQVLG